MAPEVAIAAHAGEIELFAPVDARRAGEPPQERRVSHVEWAEGIASRIAELPWVGLVGQEADELRAVAVYTVLRKASHFTPLPRYRRGENAHGHFRGWIHPSVRAECLREAKRLRGGGTFRTPRKVEVRVEGLPFRRTECGTEEVELADGRAPPEVTEDESRPRGRRWGASGELSENWTLALCRAESRRLFRRLRELDDLARAGGAADQLGSAAVWLTLLSLG